MTTNSINPSRIIKARAKLQEALAELDAALADAERPKPNIPPQPIRAYKPGKSMRRV